MGKVCGWVVGLGGDEIVVPMRAVGHGICGRTVLSLAGLY